MSGFCIKLTDQNNRTTNHTLWKRKRWNPAGVLDGQRGLCSGGFYHAYDTDDPLVALFLNPIHANFPEPKVWLAEWRGTREDDNALKMGATEMRLVEPIRITPPTTNQRVAFAILAALSVYQEPSFVEWADKWLSGEDRSRSAAWSAASAAESAASAAESAWSAAESAKESAAWSARSAAWSAARSAERAAESAAESAASSADLKTIMEDAAAWARVFG